MLAYIVLLFSTMNRQNSTGNFIPSVLCILCYLAGLAGGSAALITVTTNDNISKIESAQAGDEVVISPGTYAFRVYLTRAATNTITIRALDPANPPVWDFGAVLLDNAAGSYTAGDKARGAERESDAADEARARGR